MEHYTPSREEWEQQKQDEQHEYWTWVNTNAANLLKDAETTKYSTIVEMPNNDKNILYRIKDITGNKIEAYGSEGMKYYGLDYKKTQFIYKTHNQHI